MIILLKAILALLIVSLELGPLGRQGLSGVAVSLSVISTWAFTWFTNQKNGLGWGLTLGILHDMAGFLPFGTWTATLAFVALSTNLLKSRFFEVSSVPLSLLTLGAVSLLASSILSAINRSFEPRAILISMIANVLIGFVLYYALAVRFRFWGRWMGRRL
jgi:rod shape-determining protein MreD